MWRAEKRREVGVRIERVCSLSEGWSRVSDFLLEKMAMAMEIHVFGFFFRVFQVYNRRRRQEEMDVWKNQDLLPAFSNSGVHFFFRRMQMSGFFPLRWTNFFRGGVGWGGGFKSTPRAMSAPPIWCRPLQFKKKTKQKTPEDLVKERKEISTDKHTCYHPTLFEGTKVLRGR